MSEIAVFLLVAFLMAVTGAAIALTVAYQVLVSNGVISKIDSRNRLDRLSVEAEAVEQVMNDFFDNFSAAAMAGVLDRLEIKDVSTVKGIVKRLKEKVIKFEADYNATLENILKGAEVPLTAATAPSASTSALPAAPAIGQFRLGSLLGRNRDEAADDDLEDKEDYDNDDDRDDEEEDDSNYALASRYSSRNGRY